MATNSVTIRSEGMRNRRKKAPSCARAPEDVSSKALGMPRKKRFNGTVNRIPAAPRIQNEARQFNRSATKALKEPPTATPASWLVAKIAIARERVCGPWAAAIRLYPAGMNTDSDTPSSARHTNRKTRFGENPESTVNALQIPRLATINFGLENRSPRIPASGEHNP